MVVASDLKIPTSMMSTVVGGDPEAALMAATERADDASSDVDAALAGALIDARTDAVDLRTSLASYQMLMAAIEGRLNTAVTDLASTTSGRGETDALLRSTRSLGHAIDARSAVAESFYGYFASTFDLRDAPAVEVTRLIRSRARFDGAIASLRSASTESPSLRASVDATADGSPISALNGAIDALIARSIADGVPLASAPLSMATISSNVAGFTQVYESAAGSSATTATLIDAAIELVIAAVDSVRSEADATIERMWLLVAVVTTATVAVSFLAARFIVRPLRALQRSALHLQDGRDVVVGAPSGPLEVRAAATALSDAAAHLNLATLQVRALATGELDAQVLDQTAAGGLGVAVQHAVATLRTALARQDEFRRRLAHEATHDGLTNLSNRNASMAQLDRSLARTLRAGSHLAVFFIDLDRFKEVNDEYGHQAGDIVLSTVAQRLVTAVREGDHVGRLGGDEFVVIAEPVSCVDDAMALAARLRDQVSEPIEIGATSVTVGASIGIAVANGRRLTGDELLRDADLAVYRAKQSGHGGIEMCDEELRNRIAASTDLSVALRRAIDTDELLMYYQPILDTATREVHAFEALMRWQRPGVGLVPPDEFIGFAERSHLIVDLDRWVMGAVSRQLARWGDLNESTPVPIAINMSRRHLAHDDFVDHIVTPLRDHAIDPSLIIIEVTESALLDDLPAAAAKLQQLRDQGIRVSIDDFGTGYTSLAHLRSLPVDILKIDRSFTASAVGDHHDASIVKLIIDTGHLLGAAITAEGIETELEAEALQRLGSDHLQGFLFARPQPPDELAYSIATRKRSSL